MKKLFRCFAVGAVAATLSAMPVNGAESAGRKPNIVFILVDDWGWSDSGCYGSTFYETPNINLTVVVTE